MRAVNGRGAINGGPLRILLNPSQRLPPDRDFTEITGEPSDGGCEEQIDLLAQKADFFIEHGLLASVNIDGPTLIAMRQIPKS